MEGYSIESQRLAELAKIWHKNKHYFLIILLIATAIIVGSYLLRTHKATQSREASELYQTMIEAIKVDDKAQAATIGKQLIGDYKRTPYALLATMLLSKFAVEEEDYSAAIAQFKQVTAKKNQRDPLWHIAKIRLARLLHHIGNSEQALQELTVDSADYLALYEEVKGDIYLDLHEADKARQAYQTAIKNAIDENKPWLMAKLAEVGSNTQLTPDNSAIDLATDDAADAVESVETETTEVLNGNAE